MKSSLPFYLIFICFICSACERVEQKQLNTDVATTANSETGNDKSEEDDPFFSTSEDLEYDGPVPNNLEEALGLMLADLKDYDRAMIIEYGDDFASSVHFSSGMGIRNSWGLWGDSPLRRYFSRLGIHHADDMSAIINKAFSRRVRNKPIELDELVKYYRDYWSKEDLISPLDLNCPNCHAEMQVHYAGKLFSTRYPERQYFEGICEHDHNYYFYHVDGWLTAETIRGEQDTAPNR